MNETRSFFHFVFNGTFCMLFMVGYRLSRNRVRACLYCFVRLFSPAHFVILFIIYALPDRPSGQDVNDSGEEAAGGKTKKALRQGGLTRNGYA